MIYLGLDPGQKNGSIVGIDVRTPARVVCELSWSATRRKTGEVFRVWGPVCGDHEVDPPHFMRHLRASFSEMLAGRAATIAQLTVEQPLVAMRQRDGAVNTGTIANAYLLRGWLEQILDREAIMVTPQEWRAAIFGLSRRLDAREADEAVRRMMPALVEKPDLPLPPPQTRSGEHWCAGHRRDALGVALFGRSHV